jgi:peptidoglycan/LPS O-acetylase OafA/YrhL
VELKINNDHDRKRSAKNQSLFETQKSLAGKKYTQELDGLRGIAVILVLGFHFGWTGFGGGYLGVDAFFVISGYLITGILLKSFSNGTFSYHKFIAKRAKRLLPALTVMTLLTTIGAWVLFNRGQLDSFGDALLGVGTYTSNFVFMLSDSYFEQSTATTPLLHTWSLAVEEQFYIIFPLFALLFWRMRPKNRLFLPILLMSTASLLAWVWFREIGTTTMLSDWAFFMLPTRAWELGVGSLLAIKVTEVKSPLQTQRTRNILALIGVGLGATSLVIGTLHPDRGLASIIMVTSVALLIANAKSTVIGKVLGIRALVGIGLLSYGLYLYHYPLIAFTQILLGVNTLGFYPGLTVLALTTLISIASLRLIENPIRMSKSRGHTLPSLVGLFVSIFLILGFASKVPAIELSIEKETARALETHDWVYFPEMDEREFQLNRLLGIQHLEWNPLLIGSSRLMSVDPKSLNGKPLNLSVSGASVEDLFTLSLQGHQASKSKSIIIGLDPWLINVDSGQDRWKSISEDFEKWRGVVYEGESLDLAKNRTDFTREHENPGWITGIFESVNLATYNLVPEDGTPSLVTKKRRDGSIVYSSEYLAWTDEQIRLGFSDISNYANMRKFQSSPEKLELLRRLLSFMEINGIDVTLVLSPYHPDIYPLLLSNSIGFEEAEETFLFLAQETKTNILGSYNPELVGCQSYEFFDGMHPKESCMSRILENWGNTRRGQ